MLTSPFKRTLIYTIVTAACGLFSYIYERHSHQVYSNFMVYAFLIPLLLGVIPQLIVTVMPRFDFASSWQNILHSFAVATLIVGSLLQGMLEIYGTTSPYIIPYLIVGSGLLVVSIALWLATLISYQKSRT